MVSIRVIVRLYSISCGTLIATVSAMIFKGFVMSCTGMLNVDFPSFMTALYFTPSEMM